MSSKLIQFKKARRHRMRIAWLVWFVAALFVLFQFFLQLSSGEIIHGVMSSFTLNAFSGGVLLSSYYYIYVLLQTPAGMLMDRYGPRLLLSLGALVVCVGCALFAIAKTVVIALIGRILMGAGASFAFVGCLNVISIWFPSRKFSFMASIVETAGMFAAIMGNFWLASVVHRVGWRSCLMIAAVFGGILSVFLFLIVKNAPRKKTKKMVFATQQFFSKGLFSLLRNPLLWVNGIYSGAMFSVVTVFIALWAIPFFELSHRIDLVTASMVASMLYVGIAVGGPILGWLDGNTDLRRHMMILNAFAASVCLFWVIFDVRLSLIAVSALLFFVGICTSSYVLTFAIANEIAMPSYRATSIGLTNMLCVFFAPVLQPLVGFLLTRLDYGHPVMQSVSHFQWAVSVVPFSLMAATVIAFLLPAPKR